MKKLIQPIFLILLLLNATQLANSQIGSGMGIGSGVGTGNSSPIKPVFTAEQIAKKFLPGVALIVCEDGKGNVSQGSGYFISPGAVLTNAHVVKGMSRGVIITTATNTTKSKTFLVNTILYFNSQDTDLALLASNEGQKEQTTILPLAKPNDISIGETVYVLSNPEGLIGTISQGIVSSGIRRTGKMDLLQITAPISSGSSGGAVMNSHGEVIGIATSSLTSGQNLNFAVPAAQISQFLNQFVNDKSKIYGLADKIPNSWNVPKEFLLAQKENLQTKSLPPISKDTSKPSLEETTNWLTDKIEGTTDSYSYFNPGVKKRLTVKSSVEKMSFSECIMDFEVKVENLFIDYYKYSVNLKLLKEVEANINLYNQNGIWLSFSKNIEFEESTFDLDDGKLVWKGKKRTNEIVFIINNQDLAKKTEKAFSRAIELCKENVKEPF